MIATQDWPVASLEGFLPFCPRDKTKPLKNGEMRHGAFNVLTREGSVIRWASHWREWFESES